MVIKRENSSSSFLNQNMFKNKCTLYYLESNFSINPALKIDIIYTAYLVKSSKYYKNNNNRIEICSVQTIQELPKYLTTRDKLDFKLKFKLLLESQGYEIISYTTIPIDFENSVVK